jgi:gliding motility-associated-like protein
VTIVDEAGCIANACYTITQPDQPLTVNYTTSIYHEFYEVSCPNSNDGSIDLTVTGGTPGYSFNWLGNSVVASDEDQTGLGVGLYEVLVIDTNSCSITLSIELSAPPSTLIGATLSEFDGGFNVSCNGDCNGTIDANIVSPFGDFTFGWTGPNGFASSDEDLSDLCFGDYTIIVVDSLNCIYQNTFTIAEPEVLTASIDSTFSCETGAVTLCVNAQGGSSTYSYSWSTGETSNCISVTADGNYCVDITDSNGCTLQVCSDADASAPFEATIASTTNATCGLCNGAIDIVVTGGAGSNDFVWTGNVTTPGAEDQADLCEGAYSVTIMDINQCEVTLNTNIASGNSIDLALTGSTIGCFGDSTGTATATILNATQPIEGLWVDANNNTVSTNLIATNLPAGTYIFSYVDAVGCEDSQTISIAQNGALDIEATVSEFGDFNISEADGTDGSISVTVTGGVSPYEYQWTPAVGDLTDTEVTGLIAGNYSITVIDENGCQIDTTFTLTEPESLGLPTGLSPNGDGMNDFYVIPGVLKCGNSTFKVFNRWGNVVYEVDDYNNQWYGQSDDAGILADGTYFILFTCGSEEFSTYVDLRRE